MKRYELWRGVALLFSTRDDKQLREQIAAYGKQAGGMEVVELAAHGENKWLTVRRRPAFNYGGMRAHV